MANQTAKGVHTSLYPEHIDIITNHRQETLFNSDAAALQDIINFFGKNYKNTTIKNFLVFIGYPVAINIMLLAISQILYGLSNDLAQQGIPIAALHSLATTINGIAIAFFLFIVMSIYIFIKKTRQTKPNNR